MNMKPKSTTSILNRYNRLHQSPLKKHHSKNPLKPKPTSIESGLTKSLKSLDTFFVLNGAKLQSFDIQSYRPQHLKGMNGTEIYIPSHSFRDFNGKIVSGKVTFRLKEIYNQSDMILSDKPTMGQHTLLEAGGSLYLSAWKKNMPLRLAQPIQVNMPIHPNISNPVAMKIYKGGKTTSNPYTHQPLFDWKPSNQSQLKLTHSNEQKVFQLDLHELEWISCSFPYKNKEKSTLTTVQMLGLESPVEDKIAFIAFHHIHSVARLISKPKNFALYNLPMNQAATVFIFALDEQQQLYFGEQSLAGLSKKIIGVKMEKRTEQEIKAYFE